MRGDVYPDCIIIRIRANVSAHRNITMRGYVYPDINKYNLQ